MSWQLWVLLSGILTGFGQMIGKSQIHKISALQMGVLRDLTGWGYGDSWESRSTLSPCGRALVGQVYLAT